ncbi:MAG: 50S ribosomal protein L11 methyltransferase [Helicobacteraceae bacterium]|nr:50S ribosomal protein L11 methyltransferase [Helicobacteraceae bacterium]
MQDFYHLLVITPSSNHNLFKDFLADTLPVGFEELDDSFLVRSEDELETYAWGLQQFAEALSKALKNEVSVDLKITKEKNSDWVESYQQSIQPISVGEFYIHPTWSPPSSELLNISIDPALAFGTGHHPTTASALEAISKYVKKNDKFLDVGCGSAILAIAAIKKGAVVDACDTDDVSVENSKLNAQNNKVEFNNVWSGSANSTKEVYDVVVANIVADVLVFIASDLKKVLKNNGLLVLSGILDKYEDKVLRSYKEYEILETIKQDEWITLILKNKDS